MKSAIAIGELVVPVDVEYEDHIYYATCASQQWRSSVPVVGHGDTYEAALMALTAIMTRKSSS
jgi:hypothetical protein